MDFSIRELTVDDAARIAPVHVRSWQAAYRGLMDKAMLDSLSVEQRTEMWTGILSTPNEGARLVVEQGGEAVGFLVGTRSSPGTEGAAEVFSVYLYPSVWRGGIGSALLDAGVAALRAEGPTPIILWVVDEKDLFPSRTVTQGNGQQRVFARIRHGSVRAGEGFDIDLHPLQIFKGHPFEQRPSAGQ